MNILALKDVGPLAIKEVSGGVAITCYGYSLTLANADYQHPQIVGVYFGADNKCLVAVTDTERFAARDAAAVVAEKHGVQDLNRFIAIFAMTPNGLVCVARLPVTTDTGAQQVVADALQYTRPREYFKTLSPELAAFINKNKAKRALLNQITPADSLAALEKQVDLLTMLVFKLFDDVPLAEQPAWMSKFKDLFAQTNSATDADGTVDTMGEYKAHIRATQQQYFKARSLK